MSLFDTETAAAHSSIDALASVAQDTVAMMDSAIQTAKQSITDLRQQLADETLAFNHANDVAGKLQADLDAAKAQLAGKVYDRLDDKTWGMNSDKAVGGSGLGASAQAVSGIETAEFSIKPQIGQYYDVYCHLDFPVDDLVTKYRLETDWMFPTAADAAASQCLEMEARQVFNGHMFIVATQLMFSGNHLRYWDAVTKWTPSTSPMPRLVPGTWYHVVLDGHRDATTVYHDAVTINGVVTKLGTQYQAQPTTWRTMLRCALQLDSNGKGDSYRVKRQNTRFTVSQ